MNRRNMLIGAGTTAALGGGATWLTLSGMGSADRYAASIAPLRAPLADPAQQRDLIRYATLAPNGHNTQPWRFRLGEKQIDILPDLSRRTPVVDPDDHHIFVSLGCAAKNLSLASAARGRPGSARFEPARNGSVAFEFENGSATRSALFDAIPKRGELMRYLAEIPWAPHAIFRNPGLAWRVADAEALSISAGSGETLSEVLLSLDSDGRIAGAFAPNRPRSAVLPILPTPWRGRFSNYRLHDGIWLPFAGEVAWEIDGKEALYWQGRIKDWEAFTDDGPTNNTCT